MNIENTLNKGIKVLKANNSSSPILDSEILLSNTVKKDKKYIILNSKKSLNSDQLGRFKDLIDRRKKGEPIAYLLNKKNFGKMNFMLARMY